MRVVVVKFGAIGDMVFVTPLLRELKMKSSFLGVLTLPWSRAVLEANPHIDQLHLFDPWKVGGWKRMELAIQIVKDLRRYQYDVAIILHRSWFAPLLVWASGIATRIGFDQSLGKFLLTSSVPFDQDQHEILRNLCLLTGMGWSDAVSPQTEMFHTSLQRERMEGEDSDTDCSPVIGLFPGGGVNPGMSFPLKRWPVEHYITLVHLLRQAGMKLTIFGSEEDGEICSSLHSASGQTANWCVGRSLDEVANEAKRCDLFIGGDSGPLHIAAAVGTPTLALFGPTDPRLVAPIGANHQVLRLDLPCSPCYRLAKPNTECSFNQQCLRELEPMQVYSTVLDMLGSVRGVSGESQRSVETG